MTRRTRRGRKQSGEGSIQFYWWVRSIEDTDCRMLVHFLKRPTKSASNDNKAFKDAAFVLIDKKTGNTILRWSPQRLMEFVRNFVGGPRRKHDPRLSPETNALIDRIKAHLAPAYRAAIHRRMYEDAQQARIIP